MKRWRALFIVALGIMTWMLVSRGQEQALACQRPIDPRALTGEYDAGAVAGLFEGQRVVVPAERDDAAFVAAVLGTTDATKRIEVDLTRQRLYAFEGDRKVYEFPISSGKPWWPTPTEFAKLYFLIATIPGMFITYTSFQISLAMVLLWAVTGYLQALLAGYVFGRVKK